MKRAIFVILAFFFLVSSAVAKEKKVSFDEQTAWSYIKALASEPQNLIPPKREETYHLKYQKLVNFKLPFLNQFIEHHRDAKDSHVDVQLSLVEEEELEGDSLKIDLPSAYFPKLDEANKVLGSDHLLLVNERRLWGEEGKQQVLNVISEILKAQYEGSEMANLFSETFLRVLRDVRGEEQVSPYFYIPH